MTIAKSLSQWAVNLATLVASTVAVMLGLGVFVFCLIGGPGLLVSDKYSGPVTLVSAFGSVVFLMLVASKPGDDPKAKPSVHDDIDEDDLPMDDLTTAELVDLVQHCWVHSGYSDCGYQQMTIEQKRLYCRVIGRPEEESPLSDKPMKASMT